MNNIPRLLVSLLVAAATLDASAMPEPKQAPADRPAATSPALQGFKKAIRSKYDLKERAWAAQDSVGLVKGFYSPQAFSAAAASVRGPSPARRRAASSCAAGFRRPC